jgi:hypothetical protein
MGGIVRRPDFLALQEKAQEMEEGVEKKRNGE